MIAERSTTPIGCAVSARASGWGVTTIVTLRFSLPSWLGQSAGRASKSVTFGWEMLTVQPSGPEALTVKLCASLPRLLMLTLMDEASPG